MALGNQGRRMNSSNTTSGGLPNPTYQYTPEKKDREWVYRTKDGTLIGGNYAIPNGDFAAFLGYAPPTAEELSGKTPVSGSRVIELALRNEMQVVGERSTQTGQQARNQYIAWGAYTNSPGREADVVRDLEDASTEAQVKSESTIKPGSVGFASSEQYMKMLEEYHQRSKRDNMRYLEMQYKFHYSSKSYGTISNMMKVRHDATVRAIRESR